MEYRPTTTLAGFVVAVALPVVAVLAVATPVATAAVAALAVGAYAGGRALAGYRETRRHEDRTREVCVGDTAVCVEV